MTTKFKIDCYQTVDGMTVTADRDYALGQYADETFTSRESAQDIVDELTLDVGDVVDASIVYEVSECD